MTQDDRTRFASALAALAVVFDAEISEPKALLYERALEDIPLDYLERACESVISQNRFFPRPVEIREAAEACRRADRAEKARLDVRAAQEQIEATRYITGPIGCDPPPPIPNFMQTLVRDMDRRLAQRHLEALDAPYEGMTDDEIAARKAQLRLQATRLLDS